jgi:pimeloyl-ACP methyl ester carboxylesterase
MMALLFVFVALPMRAQDVSGDWQGSVGTGKERLRLILNVEKDADEGWRAKVYSIDQGPDSIPVTSFWQNGAEIAFSISALQLSYKGTIAADNNSIAGKLSQGGKTSFILHRPTVADRWPRDVNCACTASFITVQKVVKLEVLDWGGTGRPVILLAGLGETAHGFDHFAHKLVPKYHVYGITRRGFGESSSPPPTEANYSADRLGDDVLAMMDGAHLARPVLVGHSIAGEELSSVGSRHPEKIAGLVYLEAAYEYAFYNPARGDVSIDAAEVRHELGALIEKEGLDAKTLSELLQRLPELQKQLQAQQTKVARLPKPPAEPDRDMGPEEAILLGQRKYTKITCPVLAIFADPHDLGPMPEYTAAGRAAMTHVMADHTTTHRTDFEAGVPSAQVVAIPNARHDIYNSNEAEVVKDIDKFIVALPPSD